MVKCACHKCKHSTDVSFLSYLLRVIQGYSEIRGKLSFLPLISKNPSINTYYFCKKENRKQEKNTGKEQERRQKKIYIYCRDSLPKYSITHSNQQVYNCPSGLRTKEIRRKLMTTLLPTMTPTVFSHTMEQISIRNHSCLLCQNRKIKCIRRKRQDRLYTRKCSCISLSKKIVGNDLREKDSVNRISFL